MWARADRLLDRLRECDCSGAQADSILAQHLFMRRYFKSAGDSVGDAAIDDFAWATQRVAETRSMGFVNTFIHALALGVTSNVSDAPSAEVVFRGVEGGDWPTITWLKPLMLARPAFELGLFDVAIASLNAVLDEGSLPKLSRVLVYDALSSAYDAQRDGEARMAFLHRWSFEFPDNHSVLLKLAHSFADSADYEKAYTFLERAVKLKPELEQDVATRVGLALGQIATERASTWAELKAALARNPAIERVIEQVASNYWPALNQLAATERTEWITGVYAVFLLADQTPSLAPAWLRQAGLVFLTVAEEQLRLSVFAPMRAQAQADSIVLQQARAVHDARDPDSIFARFLGNPKAGLTLGQMVRILERAQSKSFDARFLVLVMKHLEGSPVLARIEALRRLDAVRNSAVHHLSTMDARSAHDDARQVIDAALVHSRRG
jgi:tetratricopeptide (TPR) repeat protein